MSTRRGGVTKGPPKHQNCVAYKPNRGATKAPKDLGGVDGQTFAPISGVCERCRAVIEWKRKYGKYKALKEPQKCQGCQKRNVKSAYHAICHGCASQRKVCPKCLKPSGSSACKSAEEEEADRRKVEEALRTLRERDRRALLRAMAKGSLDGSKAGKLAAQLASSGDEESDYEDDSEEEEVEIEPEEERTGSEKVKGGDNKQDEESGVEESEGESEWETEGEGSGSEECSDSEAKKRTSTVAGGKKSRSKEAGDERVVQQNISALHVTK